MIKMGDIITLGCLYIFRRCVFMGHPTGSKSVGFDGNLTLFCIDYTMFENHRKSLIQYCERSELHFE